MEVLGEVAVRVRAPLDMLEKDLADARRETSAFDQAAQRAFRGTEASMAKLNSVARETESVMARINRTTGVSNTGQFRRSAADVAQFGRELDSLRAKYNPLFAASKAYEAELDELNRAHAVGAINQMEHASALETLNLRYQANTQMLNRYGTAVKRSTVNTANLAFQFQDIAMMMAMGQSPFMLLAQQLPQVTMYGGSLNGVMTAIRSTLAGLISPLGLVTTGFVLGGSAIISWATSAEDSVDAVDEALEGHQDALEEIVEGWHRAEEAAASYRERALVRPVGEAQDDLQRQRKDLVEAQADAIERLRSSMEHLNEYVLVYARGTEFQEKAKADAAALTAIQEAARATEPDLDGIIRSLKNFVDNDPYDVLAPIATEMLNAAEAARKFDAEIGALDAGSAQINDLEAAFAALQAVIDNVQSGPAQQELEDLLDKARDGEAGVDDVREALGNLSGTTPDLSAAIRELSALFEQAIATRDAVANAATGGGTGGPRRYSRGQNTGPARYEVPLPDTVEVTPEARIDPYFADPVRRGRKRGKSDAERAAERYDQLLRNAERFIVMQDLEREALTLSAEAAAALRYEQDLLNQAVTAGVKVTPELEAEIRSYAEAMAEAESAANEAKAEIEAFNEAGQSGGSLLRRLADDAVELKDVLLDVGKIVIKLLNDLNVGSGGRGIFGGGFLQSLIGGFLGIGFANGGVFANGQVQAFAGGGVVNRPTLFPMRNGTGLMGEAGEEGILPLRRGPDGRLGVEAHGGASERRVVVESHIVSRFLPDGGFETAVERVAQPIAQTEASSAAGQVAGAVPGMALNAVSENRTRRIRPRSAL